MADQLLPGYICRSAAMADLAAVVTLKNRGSAAFEDRPDQSVEGQRVSWTSGELDISSDTLVAISSQGTLVGYEEAVVEGDCGIIDGLVDPDYTGKGIGSYLVDRAESRLLDRSPSPAVMRSSVYHADRWAQSLFESRGYRFIRATYRMEMVLAAQGKALELPPGLDIRSLVIGRDEKTAYDTVQEAFEDVWGHVRPSFGAWSARNIESERCDPELFLLLWDGNEPVGTVQCRKIGEAEAWIRGVGVRRPWRRKGFAKALLQEAFSRLYAKGYQKVGLSVDSESSSGANGLYSSLGMGVVNQIDVYEKRL